MLPRGIVDKQQILSNGESSSPVNESSSPREVEGQSLFKEAGVSFIELNSNLDMFNDEHAYRSRLHQTMNEEIRDAIPDRIEQGTANFNERQLFESPKTRFSSSSRREDKLLDFNLSAQQDTRQEYYDLLDINPPARFSGIRNQTGYWCFYIATVQGLVRTNALARLLEFVSAVPGGITGQFMRSLNQTVERLKNATKPISIRRLVEAGPEMFILARSQQDASECLTLLFNQIETQVKRLEHHQMLLEVLRADIGVEIESELKCYGCKKLHSTVKEEKFMLEVHFEKEPQLEWKEQLAYECSQCESTTAIQSSRLTHLPQLLILHMKRYQFSDGENKKLTGQSHMPLHFHEYRLAGFICHIGWYQHSGHYVFYLHEDSFEDRWIRFDDSRVTELQYGIDEIFWQGFCSNETPLIAFYRKAATG